MNGMKAWTAFVLLILTGFVVVAGPVEKDRTCKERLSNLAKYAKLYQARVPPNVPPPADRENPSDHVFSFLSVGLLLSSTLFHIALIWLAKHQSPDGHWDVYQYQDRCPAGDVCNRFVDRKNRNHNVGVTGLALLAFLGAGYTHLDIDVVREGRNVGKVVKKALKWLKKKQKADGAFRKNMYDHAIASLAYAEAYGMTHSPILKETAQRAIDFLEKAQNIASGTSRRPGRNKGFWSYMSGVP